MGDRTITAPIDPIDRGIDRLDTDVRRGKIAEGLNVINDDGDLRRRDAFKTIYTAAPHFLPPGLVTVYFSMAQTSSETVVAQADRAGTFSTSKKRIYIGCEEKFDGIDLGTVTYTTTPTQGIELVGYYYNGTAWVQMPFIFDTTETGAYADSGKHYQTTLSKDGRVSWHKKDFVSWTADSGAIGVGGGNLGGTNLFWIYLEPRISPAATAITALPGTLTIAAPGIRTFNFSKINGLFPVRTKKKDVLVVCSDREERRGSEQGAMVGLAESSADATKQLHLVQTEGSGTYNQVTIPAWQEEQDGSSYPLTPVDIGSAGTYGASAATLQRHQLTDVVDWYYAATFETEWRGGMALYVPSGSVSDNGSGSTINIIQIVQEGIVANQFEHHLLRIIGGTGDGEERMIHKNTATESGNVLLYVDDDDNFSAGAPSSSSAIKIFRPHCRAEIRPGKRDYEVLTNGASTITLTTGRPWAPAEETSSPDITNEGVHFYIGQNPRWTIPAGTSWTATYDNNSNSLYLANDHSEILRFDGKHLRTLYPETDILKDWHAERYANFLFLSQKSRKAAESAGISGTAFLENSPILAHILVSFLRKLFAIKTSSGDSTLRFSGENAFHVWPSYFKRAIPDDRNRKIQGAAALNNRLLCWSTNAIMEFAFGGSEDEFDSRILYTGGGFVSHHGVQVIKSTLVGPNTDGIYGFNGASLEPVLDDWERLIRGGINENRLDRSTSVQLQQKGWYLLSVASSGSDFNDRIVIWDYVRNQFWLWSAPHGASFLAKDYDENGVERLLIGTNDGHIQTLSGQEKDDGAVITSYARTVPLNLFSEKEAAYTGVQSVVENSASAMELKFFVDKRDAESKSIALSADAGLNKLGSFVLDNATTGTLGDGRYKTVNNNLNVKGRDFQVQMGGSSPWRLRRMYITARDLGKR